MSDQISRLVTSISDCASKASDRVDLWTRILQAINAATVAEVGVFRGVFAAALLAQCKAISKYYMIDPWKHLDGWNKPANVDDVSFEEHYRHAMSITDFASHRRVVIRKESSHGAQEIPMGSLDAAYIDGDHTLRGITIDLQSMLPRIREGGIIGGDDFSPSIWQHGADFEPTLVFPYAVHFAEALRAPIFALPFDQFLLLNCSVGFRFLDLTGKYADTSLNHQLRKRALGQRLLRFIR